MAEAAKKVNYALTMQGGDLDNQKHRAMAALLVGGGAVLNPPTTEVAHKRLEEMGENRVVEMLCSGQLEHEVAYGIGVTIFQFKAWYEACVDTARRLKVRHAQAAALVARANMILSFKADGDSTAIGLAKTQAAQFMDIAKRLHPEQWGRDKPAHDAAVGDTFILNFGALTNNINNGVVAAHVNVVRGGDTEEIRADDMMAPVQQLLGSWGDELLPEPVLDKPAYVEDVVYDKRPAVQPPPGLRAMMRDRDFTVADPR